MKRRTLLVVASTGLATGTSGCLAGFDRDNESGAVESETTDTELRLAGVYADEVDREFLDYEYVLFKNESDDSVDVSGYSVEYSADHTYEVEGLVLEPGAQLALLSRSGQDTKLTSSPPVYLRYAGFGTGSDTSVLGENGTIRVRDSEEALVVDAHYENFGCDGGKGPTRTNDARECLH